MWKRPARLLVLGVVVGSAGCDRRPSDGPASAPYPSAASARVSPIVDAAGDVATAIAIADAATDASVPPECNGDHLWFIGNGPAADAGDDVVARKRAYTAYFRSRSAECRRQAMTTLFERDCDDVIPPTLLDAAADATERAALAAMCTARRALVIERGRALLAKVRNEVESATKRDPERDRSPDCADRVAAEVRRLRAAWNELANEKLPMGLSWNTRRPLSIAEKCLGCPAVSRAPCDEATKALREAEAELGSYERRPPIH